MTRSEQEQKLDDIVSKFMEQWEDETGMNVEKIETQFIYSGEVVKLASFKFVMVQVDQ